MQRTSKPGPGRPKINETEIKFGTTLQHRSRLNQIAKRLRKPAAEILRDIVEPAIDRRFEKVCGEAA